MKYVGAAGIQAVGATISTDQAYIIINGQKFWLSPTDPAGASANGDVWADNVP